MAWSLDTWLTYSQRVGIAGLSSSRRIGCSSSLCYDHCVTPLDVAQADSGDPCLISLRLVNHKVAEVDVGRITNERSAKSSPSVFDEVVEVDFKVSTSSSLVHIKCRLKRKIKKELVSVGRGIVAGKFQP